jgi:hypothetical protein
VPIIHNTLATELDADLEELLGWPEHLVAEYLFAGRPGCEARRLPGIASLVIGSAARRFRPIIWNSKTSCGARGASVKATGSLHFAAARSVFADQTPRSRSAARGHQLAKGHASQRSEGSSSPTASGEIGATYHRRRQAEF